MSIDVPLVRRAIWRYNRVEDGLTIHRYWATACPPMSNQRAMAPPANTDASPRWEHEDVLDVMQKRLKPNPRASRIRRQTLSTPSERSRCEMGATHFLSKTLPRVSTEMSLHVLAYNLKRVMPDLRGCTLCVALIRA